MDNFNSILALYTLLATEKIPASTQLEILHQNETLTIKEIKYALQADGSKKLEVILKSTIKI